MKNKYFKWILAIVWLLIIHAGVQAQEVDSTYAARIEYIFKFLDKTKIPTALLKDAAFELAELGNYNGLILADSNLVYDQNFRDIYLTLATSQLGYLPSGVLPNPQLVDSIWLSKRKSGQVTLAGLYYQYNRFADDALNKVTIINDQIYDKYVNGIWQNPYTTKQVMAFTPAITEQIGLNFSLILPAQLWLSNNKQQVSKIEVDMNDGLGYRQLSPNVGLPVLYADSGLKILKFKLWLSNNTVMQSRSLLHVSKLPYESTPLNPGFDLGADVDNLIPVLEEESPVSVIPQGWNLSKAQYKLDYFEVASTETFNNEHAIGQVIIQYAAADKQIRKPFIVVEGLDPANYKNPEIGVRDFTIKHFLDQINYSNDLLSILVDIPQYDIIYINWKNGTADMHLNALLVKTVIRSINQVKVADGANPIEKNVVLGQSMGGVIARYALKIMELDGENHDTRLYISHDAPHQGANVPLGFQAMAIHVQQMALKSFVTAATYYFAAGSNRNLLFLNYTPAAKQLLSHRIDWNYATDNVIHNQWQNELVNLGYPQNCRNISLSNGSECGTPIPIVPGENLSLMHGAYKPGFWGDLLGMIAMPIAGAVLKNAKIALLGVIPGSSKLTYHFEANSLADGGGNPLYKGYVKYTKKILWTVSVTTTITDKSYTAPAGLIPLDQLPGSYFQVPEIKAPTNIQFNLVPFFSFIPTTSALDIGKGQVPLTQADFYQSYIGATPPAAPKNTPFDNFITAFSSGVGNNEEHISFTQRNGSWLANELNISNPLPQADCSYFCIFSPNSIQGPDNICGTVNYTIANLPAGTNVTWLASGSIQIQGANNQDIVAVNSINNGQGYLTATLVSANCGIKSVVKTFSSTGLPDVQIIKAQHLINGQISEDLQPDNDESNLVELPDNYLPYAILFTVPVIEGNSYDWSTNAVVYGGTQNQSLVIYPPDPGSVFKVQLKLTNICGSTTFCQQFKYSMQPNPFIESLGTCDYPLQLFINTSGAYFVFPNPAANELKVTYQNIQSEDAMEGQIIDFTVELYNANGVLQSASQLQN